MVATPEVKATETPYGRLAYLEGGKGTPLLLIHGSYGSASHWNANLPALSLIAHVVAPDLPGFGGSAAAPPDADLAYFASTLNDLMTSLGHRRFDVAGYSFGTLIGARLATMGTVRSLILVSPPVCGTPAAVKAAQDRIGQLAAKGAVTASVELMLEKIALHRPERRNSEAIAITVNNLRRARFRARPLQLRERLADLLSDVRCPVTALLGRQDPFYSGDSDAAARFLQSDHPGVSVAQMENAAHWLLFDDPEAANSAIASHLAAIGLTQTGELAV